MTADEGPPGRVRTPFGGARSPSTFFTTRWLFLRALGLVFLIAHVSLWTQIEGLVGTQGILPYTDYLDWIHRNLGAEAYLRFPSLAWFGGDDVVLHLLCGAGVTLSLLLIAGVAPLTTLLLLLAGYLSLMIAGGPFLSFQWDILLLESGFMSLFLAPLELRPRFPAGRSPPSIASIWLLRVLLFKLMFLSGVVKLISMDATWWNLTALDYHYFTQPLPTWTAWYAHHLPGWIRKLSVLLMFVIEIGVPFLIFLGRRPRIVAGLLLVLLQVLIASTGNYTYFNLLTVALCIPLFDDALLRRLLPGRIRDRLAGPPPGAGAGPSAAPVRRLLVNATAALLVLLSAMTVVRECVRTRQREPIGGITAGLLDAGQRYLLSWGQPYLLRWTDGFHLINGYGLFRGMTTRRPELVIEVSNDGNTWRELPFRYKVGDPGRRPRFVAPHQPRLDWQMWFAALNLRGNAQWLDGLYIALLEGRPAVLGLLGDNPFPDGPPRWLRIAYYEYEFTTPEERAQSGNWWTRRLLGRSRPISASDFARRRG